VFREGVRVRATNVILRPDRIAAVCPFGLLNGSATPSGVGSTPVERCFRQERLVSMDIRDDRKAAPRMCRGAVSWRQDFTFIML
jgi:hypothetical protein